MAALELLFLSKGAAVSYELEAFRIVVRWRLGLEDTHSTILGVADGLLDESTVASPLDLESSL